MLFSTSEVLKHSFKHKIIERFRNWAKQAPKTQSVEKKIKILCMRFVVLYNFEIKKKNMTKYEIIK